jgi:hypothetical protein
MSQVIAIHELSAIVLIHTSHSNKTDANVISEIKQLWKDQRKGDYDTVRWMDHYDPSQYSERYPAIAEYIKHHDLQGEVYLMTSVDRRRDDF